MKDNCEIHKIDVEIRPNTWADMTAHGLANFVCSDLNHFGYKEIILRHHYFFDKLNKNCIFF